MHRPRRRIGVASCVLLTRLGETALFGITGVIAVNRHTDTTTVDIVVRLDGIIIAVPGSVVGVREIGLAPRAVELTVAVSVADLGEGNLAVGGDTNNSLVASLEIEKKPGVAARAGHIATGSLPIISNFIPQSDTDCAVGSEGDGVVMAVRIAIAQG